ncbi:flagellar hook-associated protein FlgL [Scleromatobacter humisilvae]|uniref:Flagellar hook-associated protein FlgL n=1 Tax=Scleromatobacter humisilvae TaxID=2897159 RepID=A0A9X1YDM5_9BURK|nr:flagellar hook-associated protein FlgL [Scleromatobacter humisilvae]MCK9684594.1 flagellar hook-associated protein FlgL [Scleromatobacter humisilvae]
MSVNRISTSNAYDGALSNLMSRQDHLTETQEQMTSGKRVIKASDDPTAAARAERARALEERTTSSQKAVDASSNAMTLTESALGDAGELLQQARELLVSAGDASYSDAERASKANAIAAIRSQLLAVANRPDGQGGFVFSGQGSGGAPFIDKPGGVVFQGVGGEVNVATDEPLPLTLDGGDIWLSANTGNGVFVTKNTNSSNAWIDAGRVTSPDQITSSTYDIQFAVSGGTTTYSVLKDGNPVSTGNAFTSGQEISVDGMSFAISGAPANGDDFQTTPSTRSLSVFDSLDYAVAQLSKPGQGGPKVQQAVQDSIRNIDQVNSQISSARAFAGTTLQRLDGVKGRLDATELSAQTDRSSAEDLDMVKALSSFNQQQTGYQAALQSYATIQKLSLFQYLNA